MRLIVEFSSIVFPVQRLAGPLVLWVVATLVVVPSAGYAIADDELSEQDRALVAAVERHRIKAIEKVVGSVIAIYDEDRQGGGSGVIIDPSGIALTNHHVIMGAGVEGWGGLADGKLYRWKLIGTDPGGDVSVIQMEGKQEFPFAPLGDSDQVNVGDWALAMGNPFILTEDQSPTVTLGIVSGVKRYQPGAGSNQLVYGNCIQVDSSINPGNSGGPLFNLNGEVIGINGRGSFNERKRVNVGLGYAISANQIKNFIPDLLATKLVEHATLDASFSDRDGKVVCSQLNLDSPAAQSGLQIGDELLRFEGQEIKNANQFTNLICTLPEDWPTELVIGKSDGTEKTLVIRTLGLPYRKPRAAPDRGDKPRNPEQEKQLKRQRQMVKLLSAPPGEIRYKATNRIYVDHIIAQWRQSEQLSGKTQPAGVAKLMDQILRDGSQVGSQAMWLASDGRIRVEIDLDDSKTTYIYDGESFFADVDGKSREMSLVEAKLDWTLVQAMAMVTTFSQKPFAMFGPPLIDGSDKAFGQNAYRFKMLDSDRDPFYAWLRMYNENGRPAPRLLKVSASKDCEDRGGVIFDQWETVGPVPVPKRRLWISGLQEQPTLTVVNQSAEWVEKLDESWFDAEPISDVESHQSTSFNSGTTDRVSGTNRSAR